MGNLASFCFYFPYDAPNSTPPLTGGFVKGALSPCKRASITGKKGPFYRLKGALL